MKTKRVILTALALTLPLAGAMAQQWTTNTLPPGLIAWWQAEGNMLDSAGPHDGAGSTAPTYGPGHFGQAFQFNGEDQSVQIPDGHADLDAWTQFTLEAWVNLDRTDDAPGPGRSVISKVGNHRGPYSGNFGYQFGFANGCTQLFCQFNTDSLLWPGYQTFANLPVPITTNAWHHVAATYDHNAVKLYLNGVPLITNLIGPVTVANTVATLRISKDDNFNVAFAGRIDDARIYNRALTATEIARLALGMPGANGFWGLKTHDPLSQPPTTMFWFDENGGNYRELPAVTLAGASIEADGLAMSPAGELFAFQVNAPGGSQLLTLNSTTAVASVIGPVLSGRNIRGATFTLSGRLLGIDLASRELIEVNPMTGAQVGAAVPLSTNVNFSTTAGDLTQMPDGSLVFAYHESLYRLDARSGALTELLRDTAPFPDGFIPYCCGLACVPGSEPADKLFLYEASQHDDVYQYLPSAGFARQQLFDNVVPSYNAGRGDLAALPAALVEVLGMSVNGTNAALAAVCRGGCWAEVIFTDDLGAPNWQVVPGSAGWVPYIAGTIATPMTWTNLPANVPYRFFRVRVTD